MPATAYRSRQALEPPLLQPIGQLIIVNVWSTPLPSRGMVRAATDIGRAVNLGDIANAGLDDDWTLLSVPGFAQTQRERLRALPTPSHGIKLVYETIVLHSASGEAIAFTHMVDAQTGEIPARKTALRRYVSSSYGHVTQTTRIS